MHRDQDAPYLWHGCHSWCSVIKIHINSSSAGYKQRKGGGELQAEEAACVSGWVCLRVGRYHMWSGVSVLEGLCRKPVVTVGSPPCKLILSSPRRCAMRLSRCVSDIWTASRSDRCPIILRIFSENFGCVFEQEDGKSTASYLRFEHSRAINWSSSVMSSDDERKRTSMLIHTDI